MRVRFADAQHGLVLDLINLDGPSVAHYTTNGGQTAADWTTVVLDLAGGWFGNQFSFLPSLEVRASGITYCASPDGGASWNCRQSVDEVFDGPTFFHDHQFGWVGGGTISPTVEGWVHRTADGGATWSGRTLQAPWPIREIRFVTSNLGWAAGGNIYSGGDGLYFSSDGGQTWSLDLNAGAELDACEHWGASPGHLSPRSGAPATTARSPARCTPSSFRRRAVDEADSWGRFAEAALLEQRSGRRSSPSPPSLVWVRRQERVRVVAVHDC